MKKKLFAMLLTGALSVSLLAGCGGSSDSGSSDTETTDTADTADSGAETADTGATEADLEYAADAEYEPEKTCSAGDASITYDQYTYVQHTIEDAGATFVATVMKGADGYYIHNNFYGDEQIVQVGSDGTTISFDKTGFMQTDAPLIIEEAEAQGVWVAIP